MTRVLLLLVLLPFGACAGGEPLGTQCSVSTDCDAGKICVDGNCVVDPANPLPVGGEGEGEGIPKGEGEGTVIGGEGEGATGEGEGAAGEGEGAAGEGEGAAGEGEGAVGEGEGEGGPPPVCTPGCGSFQSCVGTGVCQDDAGTDVCFTFGTTTVDFFADQSLAVDAAHGDRYTFDGGDRFYVDRLTQVRPGMTVDYDIITDTFDTVVYVFDDTDGLCSEPQAKVDQFFGGDESFRVKFGQDDLDIVVTSFDSINAGTSTGAFTLKARGILCDGSTANQSGNAQDDVTDTQTTYDQCFRALYESGATTNKCSASNPCARDSAGNVNGKFCGLQPNVHTAGTPITLVTDSASGPCH